MSLRPFVLEDGEPKQWRRGVTWIVSKGVSLFAVTVRADGLYDDETVVSLTPLDPWSKLSRKLLTLGGSAVELAAGDDGYLANILLRYGTLIDGGRLIHRRTKAMDGYCLRNAQNAVRAIPGARLAVGVALRKGWAWSLHAWAILPPFGRVVDGPEIARIYLGVLADNHEDTLLERWEHALNPAHSVDERTWPIPNVKQPVLYRNVWHRRTGLSGNSRRAGHPAWRRRPGRARNLNQDYR